jgi:lipopolysaccharide/colanic/teichoic acid biosynthesis glycosyltransferase
MPMGSQHRYRTYRAPSPLTSAGYQVIFPRHSAVVARPGRMAQAPSSDRARRLLNVMVAIAALVITLPLMLVIAIAIRLTSPGPVFFRQTRVGVDRRSAVGGNWRRQVDYGGRLFTMYKFRTMYVQSEAAEIWARRDDDRITPVGRVLRKYRLDELPQFINVLIGDMNIVGPRPEQPQLFMSLRDQVERYQERQRVLPGITGWAQINQQYDQDIEDVRNKVRYDLEYAARSSAMEDLRIMLLTVPVMVRGQGGW